MSRPAEYRADIDGLRAVAVLAVLLYHLGFEGFQGGFVGVDVFFVISGFLITRLIRAEVLASGTFSFSNFYVRRARRLFPSLFFTLCLSFVLAFLLFSPAHLQRLGGSIVHALLSLGNFFFWSESGYFDADTVVKPLLHTWSLGVEEQYYLLWPLSLVLLLLKAKRYTPPLIVLSGAISLGLNELFRDGPPAALTAISAAMGSWFADGAATIFYLAPFRVFEFSFGAILVWLVRHQPRNRLALEPLVPIGLLMIAYPVLTYTHETVFPSTNALLPCLGAAVLIYAGQAEWAGRILSNRMAVGIGLISYSLYLIHWPMIVFYKYWTFRPLALPEQVAICVLSLLAAALMYRFVERPFRIRSGSSAKRLSRPAFGLACTGLSLLLLLPAANSWANRGWTWRLAGLNEELRLAQQLVNRDGEACSDDRRYVCLGEGRGRTVFVLGDSHAQALFEGFFFLEDEPAMRAREFRLFALGGTVPLFGVWNSDSGGSLDRAFTREFNFDRAFARLPPDATVIIHARFALHWLTERPANEPRRRKYVHLSRGATDEIAIEASQRNFRHGLARTLSFLADREVILVGATPHLGTDLATCLDRPTFLLTASFADRCLSFDKAQAMARTRDVNRVLLEAARQHDNTRFVDPTQLLCRPNRSHCDSFRDGRLLYRDDDHLSAYGASLLVERLLNLIG